MPNYTRKRVFAHVKPDRFIVESFEDTSVWTGSTDVSGIATSVNHREGSVSISLDKDGTTEAFGQISRTFSSAETKNLTEFLRGTLRFWINISSITNIASVQLIIGEDASNTYVYQTADTDLSNGWNEISHKLDNPTSTSGNGAAWSSVNYVAVKINFDNTSDTLNSILLDALTIQHEQEIHIEEVNLSGTGLATAANQTTMITALQIMDDWDATHNSAVSSNGTQIMHEAKDYDGSVLPNSVTEGNSVRPAATLNGVSFSYLVNKDGSDTPWDSGTSSLKTTEQSPLSGQHDESNLITASGEGNGTTYYYFDLDAYRGFGVQIVNTDGSAGDNTYTVEATVQDDGTAQASCDYVDISSRYDTAGQWSTVDGNLDAIILEEEQASFKYVRIKVVRASDGGNTDGAWVIHLKKIW